MPKFRLNKLFRDKIVDLQVANGQVPSYHLATKAKHLQLLVAKLAEKAAGLHAASTLKP